MAAAIDVLQGNVLQLHQFPNWTGPAIRPEALLNRPCIASWQGQLERLQAARPLHRIVDGARQSGLV